MAPGLLGFAAVLLLLVAAVRPEDILLEESAQAHSINASVGGKVLLECDANPDPEAPGDKIRTVIWYKQGHEHPIYTYDTRNGKPTHYIDKGTFGDRAHFRTDLHPASLVVERLRAEDSGQYRCRVDFSKSPTANARHNLTILLPPSKLLIIDGSGNELANGTVGPYAEGTTHNVTCVAIGGEPTPRVYWWKSYALLSSDMSKSSILVTAERKDHGTELTCQAITDQSMAPMSVTYKIAVNLKPLWVKMQGNQKPLIAGQQTELACQVVGATPKPSISWWKSGNRMKNVRESMSDDGNVTTSIVSFIPAIEDAGKVISCRSVQASLVDSTREDGWRKIIIEHSPIVKIELGSNLNGANIVEHTDVYLDCKVKANPPHHLVSFTHNGDSIKTSSGVLVSNQSLVLQNVSRNMAGMFACKAKNVHGEETSNKLLLDVKYAPQCRVGGNRIFRAARGEIIPITCNVDANPNDSMYFRWWLNETSHTRRDLPSTISSHNLHQLGDIPGVFQYKIESPSDYGWLMCAATNTVGEQRSPCVFQIIAADKPSTLVSCEALNVTYNSLMLSCIPGKDGGIKQTFLFKLYDMSTNALIKNISSEIPECRISELPAGARLLIHASAYNLKGSSDIYKIQASTLKFPEKITGFTPVVVQLTPLLACVTGATIVIIVLATATVVLVRCRSKGHSTRNSRGNATDAKKSTPDDASNSPLTASKDNDSIDSLDKNPDIIPMDYKQAYEVNTTTSDYSSMKPLLLPNPEKYEDGNLKRVQADSASQFSQYSETDFTQGQYIQIRPIDYRLRPPNVVSPNVYGRPTSARNVYDTVYEDMLKFRSSPCSMVGTEIMSHQPELYIRPHGPFHAMYSKNERDGVISPVVQLSRSDSPNSVNFASVAAPYTLPMTGTQRLQGMANSPYVISSTLPQATLPRDRRLHNQPPVQAQPGSTIERSMSNQ